MLLEDKQWFEELGQSPAGEILRKRPIAYFCAEYALLDKLPIFAGGLGVLAGDYVREAVSCKVPLVAVGMYYTQGFERKELSVEGKVVEMHADIVPEEVGLVPVMDVAGRRVMVAVPIQDKKVWIQAWQIEVGGVRVILLDTRVEENDEDDRHISDKLYDTNKEIRLKQEIVLGIGGFRMLMALGYHPSKYHLNEGHSAFLMYELIRHEMVEHSIGFEEAKKLAGEHVLFTNHTLVPAGNDIFSDDLVSLALSKYAREIEVPLRSLIELGLVQQSSSFSMTMLALRTAGKINAVSKLHATKAAEIWKHHKMFAITNGIHLSSWDKIGEDESVVEGHQKQKRLLLERIRSVTGEQWDEKTILLGWARRMVHYKRPLTLVERLKRFGELARNKEKPIKLVYAGLSHPADEDGIELLSELQYRLESDLKGVAVYLPNYNRELAELLVAGCDLWINTPVVGFEACGTSGMKAALNGGLPLTTKDGWVDEVNMYKIGWLLSDDDVANEILDKLEKEILPLYYQPKTDGVVREWEVMMKNARKLIQNEFCMTRVMRQYFEEGYGITC